MKKFIKWLLISSENPENISLTVKGIATYIIPIAIAVAQHYDYQLSKELALNVLQTMTVILSSIVTLVGLLRKLGNTFKPKL